MRLSGIRAAGYVAVMSRRLLLAVVVLLPVIAATSHAASSTISPCRQVSSPAWSPDGSQIVFYGRRWPPPKGHAVAGNILRAFCVMNADGTNLGPLDHTVCSEHCPDLPWQIAWPAADELVALRGEDVLKFAPGSEPKSIATVNDMKFSLDPAADRLAAGPNYGPCAFCAGPVTTISLATGKVVGTAGGKTVENTSPSLSPDGKKVAFERSASDDSGREFGIWKAYANGRGLKQLAKSGDKPMWSPVAGEIAYVWWSGKTVALRLVPASGRKSRILVPGSVENVFGWSPDGRYVAFETGTGTFGRLAVVDVTTGKLRRLLRLYYSPLAVWKPDSTELLAYSSTTSGGKCWTLTRVPIDGSTPTIVESCNS